MMVTWWRWIGALPWLLLLGLPPAAAQQRTTARVVHPAETSFYLRNWTRTEGWNFFEPHPGGGDPTYADVENRLQFGFRHKTSRIEFLGALQYVQFGGLPANSSGPGPLGVGAAYFGHSGNTDSRQLYLRYLNVRLKQLARGLDVQVGRMAYDGGMESPSGNEKIEAVKRLRVAARMIGEFEWSIYQRGYDGVRLDLDRPAWHASAFGFRPTQGGFEDAAGVEMKDVELFGATLSVRPDRLLPKTDTQFFFYRYDDRRDVRARPDNTGLSANRVNVKVNTFGATLVGAYPNGDRGALDTMLWLVGQTGSWYGQRHRAYAVAGETGYQWSQAAWRPWIRAGLFRGSGDDDPTDNRHGTFFQMMPTVRKYALSATYNLMNSTDLFVQAIVHPSPPLDMRFDVHRLGLTSSADRWYFGSGATQNNGTIFGFGSRPSNGASHLGTVFEGSANYRLNTNWSINGYLGFIQGGDVVDRSFAGDQLTFGYVEQVWSF